jgi:hypothetical protein
MTPEQSKNSTSDPNPNKPKSILEMTWEEILALPSRHIPREKVAQTLKESVRKPKR